MRLTLVASLLVLAGCSSHQAASPETHADPNVVLASDGGAHCAKKTEATMASGHCSAAKVEMASAEGGTKSCHAKKAEMASAEGASCHKKVEMASTEGETKSCHRAAEGTLAANTEGAEARCSGCPMKADGSCDHEAGAKAGRECCKAELAKTATP